MTTRTQKRNSVATMGALFLVFGVTTANANSWRINNDETKKAHFADINAAMSSVDVVDGDTLYLDPGCLITTTQDITKRVTIIGTGWLQLSKTPPNASISGTVSLNAEGIKVEGLEITSTIYVAAPHITLERCKLVTVSYSGSNAQYATIRQCFVSKDISGAGNSNIMVQQMTAYWTIENCIIASSVSYPVSALYCALVRNNYIKSSYTNSSSAAIRNIKNCSIINNIIIQTGSSWNRVLNTDESTRKGSNNIFHHNVVSAQGTFIYINTEQCYNYFFEDDNKMLGSDDETKLFVLTGNTEEQYQLSKDSPAKGYATDGGDCGPFGGIYPYSVGGLPFGMPYIVSSNIPTNSQEGKVQVSQVVKLQNK